MTPKRAAGPDALAPSVVARRRLANQHLTAPASSDPGAVVARMGAVQAQDYAGAKWAVGMRTRGATDASVERAVADGTILRTHVLRPTWHFVTSADIRWMLALTAPRVKAAMASADRGLGIDDALCKRSNAALARALRGGRQLTRTELAGELGRAGIDAADTRRVAHLMSRAELDAVVCSGARRGKQFTYALLDERAPATRPLPRDEALYELAWRYFTTRGPATAQDFSWWSGLTIADARRGAEAAEPELEREPMDGRTYWFPPSAPSGRAAPRPIAHLLPNYDELLVAYRDRSAAAQLVDVSALGTRQSSIFDYVVVLDGQVVGRWKHDRTRRGAAMVALTIAAPLTDAGQRAVSAAARAYGEFLEMPLEPVMVELPRAV